MLTGDLTGDLTGKHAFVTGGGTGIGAAAARALAGQGATVTIAGIDIPSLQTMANGNDRIEWRAMDVTDEAEVSAVMAAAESALGPIDILIANAGIGEAALIREITLEHWRRVHAVNVEGVMLTMRHVLGPMTDRGWGRIVTIASAAGLKGYERLGAYAASKHAVVGLTRCASEEIKGTGVTANAVCPLYTNTAMVQGAAARIAKHDGLSHEDAETHLGAFNPLGRLIDPEEIANAVLWLCMPGSDAVNGQEIAVGGGQL